MLFLDGPVLAVDHDAARRLLAGERLGVADGLALRGGHARRLRRSFFLDGPFAIARNDVVDDLLCHGVLELRKESGETLQVIIRRCPFHVPLAPLNSTAEIP